MTSIDAMAEANYSSRDPQHRCDEAILDASVDWEELKNLLDQASIVISRILDKNKTEEAMVTDALIAGALLRAERNTE